MSNGWRTVAGDEFALRYAQSGVRVRCLVCVYVSPNGGAIRHRQAFVPDTHAAADWIRDHAHGELRSMEEAKTLAATRARNSRALRSALNATL